MAKIHSSTGARSAGAFLRTVGLAAGLAALGTGPIETAHSQTVANPMKPTPIPAQLPAKDGMAQIPDTRLWYWDTGGPGVPIVLLHPATGSALIWGYQQPVFAKAGYRVIAYSRRGYYNSAPFDPKNPGIGSEDLRHLADTLGLRRFHVLASAAGGSIASDFAFSYQDRLLSLTISSNSFGVRDGEIAKAAAFIRPKGWEQMPAEFRELGPSYRAANPEGVKAWMELEHKALIGSEYRQTLKNRDHPGKAQGTEAADAADLRRCRHVDAALDLAHDRCRDSEQPRGSDTRVRPLDLLGTAGALQSRRARLHRQPVEIIRPGQRVSGRLICEFQASERIWPPHWQNFSTWQRTIGNTRHS